MTGAIVEHIKCNSADEFLDALSPRGPCFGSNARNQQTWAFRGHGNDECYKLVPKALRSKERTNLYAIAQISPEFPEQMELNHWQVRAEISVVERFIRRCNDYGLKVPGYGTHLNETLRNAHERLKCGSEVLTNWPYESIQPALCLAQHHGLPTRLLDWSFSQFKATLFAARDALKGCTNGKVIISARDDSLRESISVWALRLSALKRMRPISPCMNQDRVDLVQVARCDNLYLHAQEGLFTLCRVNAFLDGETVDWRPLNEQIEAVEMQHPYGFQDFPVLYHFTLPHEEVRDCLAGLEKEAVTAATLYPDYKGVVESLYDEA